MLTELAEILLNHLRAVPEMKICPRCVGNLASGNLYDAKKAIRDLILSGYVSCDLDLCSECGSHQPVAFLRARARKH